jgi:hypothetical protein
MTKKQAENINVVFKNTKSQIDRLKIELDSITKIKPTKNTIQRTSILIPNGNYLLYNYNEQSNRYELDAKSMELAKENKEPSNIFIGIGFITFLYLLIWH